MFYICGGEIEVNCIKKLRLLKCWDLKEKDAADEEREAANQCKLAFVFKRRVEDKEEMSSLRF